MINKRDILIAIIFFLIGSVVMYFYHQKTMQSNKVLTDRFVANCGAAMVSAHKLLQNCNRTNDEIVACYSDLKACNWEDFKNKVDNISKESIQLNEDLKSYAKEAERLIPPSK